MDTDYDISERDLTRFTKNIFSKDFVIPPNALHLVNNSLRKSSDGPYKMQDTGNVSNGQTMYALRPTNLRLTYHEADYLAQTMVHLTKKLEAVDASDGPKELEGVDRDQVKQVAVCLTGFILRMNADLIRRLGSLSRRT